LAGLILGEDFTELEEKYIKLEELRIEMNVYDAKIHDLLDGDEFITDAVTCEVRNDHRRKWLVLTKSRIEELKIVAIPQIPQLPVYYNNKCIEPKTIYLPIAKAWIQGRNGTIQLIRCIVNEINHHSFVNSELCDDLKPKVVKRYDDDDDDIISTGETGYGRWKLRFTLHGFYNNKTMVIEAIESGNAFKNMRGIQEDIQQRYKTMKIAMIIGSDYCQSVTDAGVLQVIGQLALAKSKIG
jgi:hypothetical protein